MEGINMEDIISEDSEVDQTDEEKRAAEDKRTSPGYGQYMKCLNQSTHPLDFYNNLSKNQDIKID